MFYNAFLRLLVVAVVCLSAVPVFAQTKDVVDSGEGGKAAVNPFPDAIAVPPGILDGGTEWLNTSAPIDLKELRGKIVLLDFWTYCCINCIHVLPDLKYLEDKYKNELVVIGVHSAKFDNEKLSENIRDAILRYEIKHPVVNDSEMKIWRKFGTRSWPTLALIDPEGNFAGSQGGEGNRELFDLVIGKIIDYHREKGTLDETPMLFDLEQSKAKRSPLRYPGKVLADAASNRLFVSDSNHNRIVIADLNGKLLDVVGSGAIGRADGTFEKAEFDHPQGMELVGDMLYVADTENHLLREIDLIAKSVSTLSGTGKQGRPRVVDGDLKKTDLNSPWALSHIDGTLYIAMAGPHQIWSHKLGSDEIKVHAGNAREDILNGRLLDSAFAQPSGLTADAAGSYFFVADSEGSSIRQVAVADDGMVTTIAGTSELPRGQSLFAFGDVDGVGADARFQHPLGVAWHDGYVYVADTYNHKIRKVSVKTGVTETWLGDGIAGNGMSPAQLSEPSGLSVAGGRLYIADTNNHRILSADLITKDVKLIEIVGLSVPDPVEIRKPPSLTKALDAGEQAVSSNTAVSVKVNLSIQAGHQLNTYFPVTWQVFLLEGDQVIASDALQGRDEANLSGDTASFKIPLSGSAGTATVAVEVSYGYCDTSKGKVCRLSTALWKMQLSVSDETNGTEISLNVPQASAPSESVQSNE